MGAAIQSLCEKCEAPFEPTPYTLPGIGGTVIELQTTLCPHCAKQKAIEEHAAAKAARQLRTRPLSDLMPTKGEPITTNCRLCEQPFEAETSVFQGDKNTKPKTIYPTVCDECATVERMARPGPLNPTQEDRRRKMWVGMTGIRYADFSISELPAVIRTHAEKVLAWTVQPKGVGLLGPSRSGKSPLMYALGQKLFLAGHDVLPTSGIAFLCNVSQGEHIMEFATAHLIDLHAKLVNRVLYTVLVLVRIIGWKVAGKGHPYLGDPVGVSCLHLCPLLGRLPS